MGGVNAKFRGPSGPGAALRQGAGVELQIGKKLVLLGRTVVPVKRTPSWALGCKKRSGGRVRR